MQTLEIISLIVTIVCLLSFSLVFTFLFRHYFLSQIHTIENGEDDLYLLDNVIEETKLEKSKRRKAMRIVGKVISYLILGVVAAFFIYSLVNRFTSGVTMIGDKAMVVIGSGSMSQQNEANTYLKTNNLNNQFNTYDIIQIKKYKDVDQVKLYDVVAYRNDENIVIVHRVIEIKETDGTKTFITQGDSNNASDVGSQYKESLSYDRIVGYYTNFRIQGVGAFIVFLQSNSGIITIFCVLYCFGMYEYYSDKYQKSISKRTDFLLNTLPFSAEYDSSEDVEQTSYENLCSKVNRIYLQMTSLSKKRKLMMRLIWVKINLNLRFLVMVLRFDYNSK